MQTVWPFYLPDYIWPFRPFQGGETNGNSILDASEEAVWENHGPDGPVV